MLTQECLTRPAGGQILLDRQLQRDKISLSVRSNQSTG
jgi:hypothetical protein